MTPMPMPPLPALRLPGDPDRVLPVVVVDTREQTPLTFTRLPSVTGTLTTGDYSFVGAQELFAIERKSIADLAGCCSGSNRDRFERELHRLRGYRFKRLLVVGTRAEVEQHRYRSQITPKAVLATLAAFEVRYDVPVVWSPTPEDAAAQIEAWVWWFGRELIQQVNTLGLGQAPGVKSSVGST